MEITLGQQYNVGRSQPLYCTLTLIVMQGHQENSKKQNRDNVVHHHMVGIIYYCIGYIYEATTTWYLTVTGFPNGSNLGSTV